MLKRLEGVEKALCAETALVCIRTHGGPWPQFRLTFPWSGTHCGQDLEHVAQEGAALALCPEETRTRHALLRRATDVRSFEELVHEKETACWLVATAARVRSGGFRSQR